MRMELFKTDPRNVEKATAPASGYEPTSIGAVYDSHVADF
jgi:hypothetical protein